MVEINPKKYFVECEWLGLGLGVFQILGKSPRRSKNISLHS